MDQGFPAMTSYPPEAESTTAEVRARMSSQSPRAKTYHQAIDTHNTSMAHGPMLTTPSLRNYPPLSSAQYPYPHEPGPSTILNNPPRYPESSQRTLHQYHDHALSHYTDQPAAPTYVDHLTSGFHSEPGSISRLEHLSRPRYPSITDATTDTSHLPSFHDPFSSNLHSPSSNYQLPPMFLHLPPEPQELLDYRDSMRSYHDLHINDNPYRRASFQSSLRLSHRVHHHNTAQDPRLYPDNQPIPQIASRRNSTTSDHSQDPSSQSQQRRYQHQQHLTPLVYDSGISSAGHSTSYPSSSGESQHSSYPTAARTTTYSTGSYNSTHASSSIPMSNSHAHFTNNNSAPEHRHDISTKCTQSLPDGRLQYNYSPNPTTDLYLTPSSVPSLDASRFDRHADLRAKSTLDPLRNPFSSHTHPSAISPNHSPLGTSDNDSAMDSDGVGHEDDDHEVSLMAAGSRPNSIFIDSQNSKRTTKIREGEGEDGAAEDVQDEQPKKKKKKSKMHGCDICGKKFPRPSGLKTHMNTHNNEKPFPCEFPGCTRTFGVRSNAKRHLRTHGVVPTASDVQPQYVVGFEPPVVLPPHLEPRDNSSSSNSKRSNSSKNNTAPLSSAPGLDGAGSDSQLRGGVDGVDGWAGDGAEQEQDSRDHYQHPPPPKPSREYKIKWMPLGLSSRTNAASLREVEEEIEEDPEPPDMSKKGYERSSGTWGPLSAGPWSGGYDSGKEEEEEEKASADQERRRSEQWHRARVEDRESEDRENAATDHARGLYSDMATTARLSNPLRPRFSSSASGMGLSGDATSSGRSELVRSSMDGSMGSTGILQCRCTPRCPSSSSGSNMCTSSSSSSFGLPSLSSSSSALSSSIAPTSSGSMSASPQPGSDLRMITFSRGKPSVSEHGEAAALAPAAELGIERNSDLYLGFGSHPYRPSQFRGFPRPLLPIKYAQLPFVADFCG